MNVKFSNLVEIKFSFFGYVSLNMFDTCNLRLKINLIQIIIADSKKIDSSHVVWMVMTHFYFNSCNHIQISFNYCYTDAPLESDYIRKLNSLFTEKDIILLWAEEFQSRQNILKLSHSVQSYYNTFNKQLFCPLGKILVIK